MPELVACWEQRKSIQRSLAHANGLRVLSFTSNRLASMFRCFDATDPLTFISFIAPRCQFTWEIRFSMCCRYGRLLSFFSFMLSLSLFIHRFNSTLFTWISFRRHYGLLLSLLPLWQKREKTFRFVRLVFVHSVIFQRHKYINKWYAVDASLKHPFLNYIDALYNRQNAVVLKWASVCLQVNPQQHVSFHQQDQE